MTSHAASHHLAPTTQPPRARRNSAPYDPWLDVRQNWPQVQVVIEVMAGDLLGEVRNGGSVIALRADTSAAQRRCTLTHELVHLERGIFNCGPWLQREELLVHATVATRLIPLDALISAIRDLGGPDDQAALAHWLDVDSETLALRLARLTTSERRRLRRGLARQSPLWSVA
ncbi:MAG: ImmA/IrrE family metallo-endopeptidase [Actinomycetota bacterium]|nr:ImmA/IrrE family metallo-endopeptidase [Actinomycetota bacterium]MDQ2957219.1 ImmA/IrrE family metallo-endopeptidase [Actinomycetota bacterium]